MDQVTSDILAKAAIAAVLFAAGRAYPWSTSWIRHWRAKRFWHPIVASHPTVVVGKHQVDWEASDLIGVGDAKAVDELRLYFRTLYLPAGFPVRIVDELSSGVPLSENYLCIGGPDTSPGDGGLIGDLWRRAETSYKWLHSTKGCAVIGDGASGEEWKPRHRPDGKLVEDYALIVKMPNPYCQPNTNKWVLLFAGCFGYGTWGALRFATTSEFVRDQRVAANDAFECLLSVEVVNRAPGKISLLDVRALEERVSAEQARALIH